MLKSPIINQNGLGTLYLHSLFIYPIQIGQNVNVTVLLHEVLMAAPKIITKEVCMQPET